MSVNLAQSHTSMCLRQLHSNGDRYCGRWHFNMVDQQWEGNPADLAKVEDLMSSLKHKVSLEDSDRSHSLPMTKDFMDRMLTWSLKSCLLLEAALHVLQQVFGHGGKHRMTGSDLQMDLSEQGLVSHHLEQLAFNVTTWTLWTRQVLCNFYVQDENNDREWMHD